MNASKHFKNVRFAIIKLRKDIKYKHEVNVLIKAFEFFNNVITKEYNLEAVESLIYVLFIIKMHKEKVYKGNRIPLTEFYQDIDRYQTKGKDILLQEVKEMINQHRKMNLIKNKKIDELLNQEDFEKELNNYFNQIMENIKWKIN